MENDHSKHLMTYIKVNPFDGTKERGAGPQVLKPFKKNICKPAKSKKSPK